MTDFSLEFVFASGEKHSPKAEPNEWLLRSDADTVADSLTVRFSVGKRTARCSLTVSWTNTA